MMDSDEPLPTLTEEHEESEDMTKPSSSGEISPSASNENEANHRASRGNSSQSSLNKVPSEGLLSGLSGGMRKNLSSGDLRISRDSQPSPDTAPLEVLKPPSRKLSSTSETSTSPRFTKGIQKARKSVGAPTLLDEEMDPSSDDLEPSTPTMGSSDFKRVSFSAGTLLQSPKIKLPPLADGLFGKMKPPAKLKERSRTVPASLPSGSFRRSTSWIESQNSHNSPSSAGISRASDSASGTSAGSGSERFRLGLSRPSTISRSSRSLTESVIRRSTALARFTRTSSNLEEDAKQAQYSQQKAAYRGYVVGDAVLINDLTQTQWANQVNKYGYPPGDGVTPDEQRGPYMFVLGTIKRVHFEEYSVYYTVTREDTKEDIRGEAG